MSSGRERSHGRTMGAALKGFLVKRMQELKEEGHHGARPVIESRVVDRTDADDVHTPSSLSDSDERVDRTTGKCRKKKKKKKEKRKRKESARTRSVSGSDYDEGERQTSDLKKTYQINNDIHITIHRGDSREEADKDYYRECKTDIGHDRHMSRSKRHRSRSRSRSRSKKHRSSSSSRTSRSRSKHKSRDKEDGDSSRKRSARKEKKEKQKTHGEKSKMKKVKKDKSKSREKKKRKQEVEDGDVELDENGEKIDYNFEEVDPDEFAEDGEVTEESEPSQPGDEPSETKDSGSDGLVITNRNIKVEWEPDIIGSKLEPGPTVEAIVAVSKACRDIRLADNSIKRQSVAHGVFECDNGGPTKPTIQKSKDVKMSLKLSETSRSLITSGLTHDERRVVREDGEVSCTSSSGLSDVSSCSLAESRSERKEKIKKRKERKKEKKKKKEKRRKRAESGRRHRSVSTSRSRSPKRRKSEVEELTSSGLDGRDRMSHSRRSGSLSGRKRARSPDLPHAGRCRSPSPRTTRRRSRSPRRRRSRSPAYYQWKQRDQMTRDYRARLIHRSRTPVRERLGRRRSRSPDKARSPSLFIDKAALRAAAIKNTLASQAKGKLPVSLTAEELARLRSGASEDQQQLTEFCKNLMRKPGNASESDDEPTQLPVRSGSEEEEEGELTDSKGGIVFNIKNAKQVPILTPAERAAHSAVLSNQFPVSSGSHHRKHEEWVPVEPKPPKPKPPPAPSMPKPKPEKISTLSGIAFSATEHKDAPQTLASVAKELAMEVSAQALQPSGMDALPVTNIVRPEERIFPVQARPGNIGELVTVRLNAMKRIALNPNDVEAIGQVYDANQKIEEWTSSKIVPGHFHGSTEAKILTREELEGNKRNQCWAKPGQFHTAQPVQGLGMFLLEKMGWKQGTGLGKNNEGPVEPLLLDLKNDRKGLISNEEILMNTGTSKPRARPIRDLSEKHPISALMELCQRRKWRSPNFVEMNEVGPAHKRRFLYKVIINGVEYQPTMGSQTKKMAKADAANVCLQALGLVPKDTTAT